MKQSSLTVQLSIFRLSNGLAAILFLLLDNRTGYPIVVWMLS
jgi:hypothetical protein